LKQIPNKFLVTYNIKTCALKLRFKVVCVLCLPFAALRVNGITRSNLESEYCLVDKEHRVMAETGFQHIRRKNATYHVATPLFFIRECYIPTYIDYEMKFYHSIKISYFMNVP
jgi:hypothetical protein